MSFNRLFQGFVLIQRSLEWVILILCEGVLRVSRHRIVPLYIFCLFGAKITSTTTSKTASTTTTTARPVVNITAASDFIVAVFNTSAGRSTGGYNGTFGASEDADNAIDGFAQHKIYQFCKCRTIKFSCGWTRSRHWVHNHSSTEQCIRGECSSICNSQWRSRAWSIDSHSRRH